MFMLFKDDVYTTVPIEYVAPTASEAFHVGEACVVSANGTLTACKGAVKPTYICVGEIPANSALEVPTVRVHGSQVYEVPLSAAGSSLKVGNKVTISGTGLEVTATTSDGVAEIVKINGTNEGDTVLVRF